MNSQPRRILFVTTAYPRRPDDVITPWLVQLIHRLRRQGIDVSVFTSSYRGLGRQILDGVPVFRFRYFLRRWEILTHEQTAPDRFGQGLGYVLLSFSYVLMGTLNIIGLIRRRRFDIVHVHWPFPHILFGLAAKAFSRCRLFATFYGLEIRWFKKKFSFLRSLFAWAMNRADVVTAISNHTASELTGIVRGPVPVIPFSVSTAVKTEKPVDGKTILFVGRAVQRKGVDVLIRAFAAVEESLPHRLVIVGDGPERPAWQALARELGGDRIEFTGWIRDDELAERYRTCSFFVLPAVYDRHGDTEGLGVVMIEAMSYAKPVIASRVGGITDVVTDGVNGLLVPSGDPVALARAISTLATDQRLCQSMGQEAKKTVDEKFNWDIITRRLIRLYEKYH